MNAYLASVIENVKSKYANEPEFVQDGGGGLLLPGACDREGIRSMKKRTF